MTRIVVQPGGLDGPWITGLGHGQTLSAVRARARPGVAPGLVGTIFTNNDDAYRTAIALKAAGVGVASPRGRKPSRATD